MAIHASAKKAARQALWKQEKNRAVRSSCRKGINELRVMLDKKKKPAKSTLDKQLNLVEKSLMRAANHGVYKKKTASRYVSRLSAAVHAAAK